MLCPAAPAYFAFDPQQVMKGRRRPISLRDQDVRPRERVYAPTNHLGKFANGPRIVDGLIDQPLHEVQDVSNPVIELGNQDFLPLLSRFPFRLRRRRELEGDLKQGYAQRFRRRDFDAGPRGAAPPHDFLSSFKALARCPSQAVGADIDRLVRVPGPRHGLRNLFAEKDEVIARLS